MAQWSSQVNWTMIMSSRGWHALHGLAELPATLGTGIRRVGGVRAIGKTATEARQVYDAAKAYQDAGAIGVEIEIADETTLVVHGRRRDFKKPRQAIA